MVSCPPVKYFVLTVPRRYFFCGSFLLFISCVCQSFASVHCCLVFVTYWAKADLLTLVCVVHYAFVSFPCGILGQVWFLILSFPDLCRLSFFQSYLSGRRHRVVLPGSFSKWVYIKAGVPQGSILGPFLFYLFINVTVKKYWIQYPFIC